MNVKSNYIQHPQERAMLDILSGYKFSLLVDIGALTVFDQHLTLSLLGSSTPTSKSFVHLSPTLSPCFG